MPSALALRRSASGRILEFFGLKRKKQSASELDPKPEQAARLADDEPEHSEEHSEITEHVDAGAAEGTTQNDANAADAPVVVTADADTPRASEPAPVKSLHHSALGTLADVASRHGLLPPSEVARAQTAIAEARLGELVTSTDWLDRSAHDRMLLSAPLAEVPPRGYESAQMQGTWIPHAAEAQPSPPRVPLAHVAEPIATSYISVLPARCQRPKPNSFICCMSR